MTTQIRVPLSFFRQLVTKGKSGDWVRDPKQVCEAFGIPLLYFAEDDIGRGVSLGAVPTDWGRCGVCNLDTKVNFVSYEDQPYVIVECDGGGRHGFCLIAHTQHFDFGA